MKVFLLGRGRGWIWARTFLNKVATASGGVTEVVTVDGEMPRDTLAALEIETEDVLVLEPFVLFANEDASADVSIDAVRNEAQRAILTIELARRIPRTLFLRSAEAADWPRQIAELLEMNLSDVLPLAEPMPDEATSGESNVTISTSPTLLRSYLIPLAVAAGHSASITVVWPRDCFLYGDMPGESLPAAVEVAGRGRILAYGPYMPLPKGQWRATVYLGFSADIGSMPFILESDTDAGIARGFFEVKQGGIFTLDLDFKVTDPFHLVEFRLVSQDSALEGLVSLIEIRLEQSSSA